MVQLGVTPGPPLVGRATEAEQLRDFPRLLAAGPAALVLQGPPGIGKTSLWQLGIQSAAPRALVLMARPTELDRASAYSGLADLLDDLDESVQLPRPGLTALSRAIGHAESLPGEVDPRAVALAAAQLLSEISTNRTVILAIDDLQWLDPSSGRVIGYVLRRLHSSPLGLMAAQRGHGASDWITAALTPDRIRRADVEGLDVDEIGQLITRRLSASFLRPVTARIHVAAGGNPFFALELARGVLQSRDPVSAQVPLAVPPSLSDLVGRRLAAVPAATREALLVVAMAQRPTVSVIERVAGAHARSALQRGVDAGLVAFEGGHIRFTHPLLAEIAYAQADPAHRRRLHRALAEVAQDVEERASHLAAGTSLPNADVAAALEDAASAARKRGAPEAAASLAASAGELTPDDDPEARHRRMFLAAEEYAVVGQGGRAAEIFRGLAAELRPGPQRARLLRRIGMLSRTVGSWSEARASLLQAREEVGTDHRLHAEIEQELAVTTMQSGDLRLATAHVQAARALVTQDVDRRTAADCEVVAVMHEVASGGAPRPGWVDRVSDLATASLTAGWRGEDETMRVVFAAASLKWMDEFDHARDLLDQLRAILWDRQEDGLLLPVLFQLCELECWSGRMDRARELAQLAQETCYRAGMSAWTSMFLYLKGLIAARTGDLSHASDQAASCLTEATRSGDVRNRMRAFAIQGFTALSSDDPQAALEPLERCMLIAHELGYGNPAVIRCAGDHIEALVATRRHDDAERRLKLLHEQALRTHSPWATMVWHRGQGVLDAARGDLASAIDQLEQASTLQGVSDHFERGRCLLALAVVQRRANRRGTARLTALQALDVFTSVEAGVWAERAAAELARLERRTMGDAVGLTGMEGEVAELVAAGRTNNEIAAQLYVSTKTVETHLTHIYRKLGLRSRTELASHLNKTAVATGEIPDAGARTSS